MRDMTLDEGSVLGQREAEDRALGWESGAQA